MMSIRIFSVRLPVYFLTCNVLRIFLGQELRIYCIVLSCFFTL